MDAIVSGPGDGERFDRGNRVVTIRGETRELSVIEIEFDATFSVDPHTHADHVDTFYVLDGVVEFTLGDETRRAGPGTLVAVPPGIIHGFRNPGSARARILNLHAPDARFASSVRGR